MALDLLSSPALDDVFAPQARPGVASHWHSHVPFAQWLVAATAPRCVVEMGADDGVSYGAFCETVLRHHLTTRCYKLQLEGTSAFRDFHDGRYGAFSQCGLASPIAASHHMADGTVDLLHIDGLRPNFSVRQILAEWEPKLSSRAIVLVHGTRVFEPAFDVAAIWTAIAARHPAFEFLHGSGLGVLCWGAEASAEVLALCQSADTEDTLRLRARFATLGRLHDTDAQRIALEAEQATATARAVAAEARADDLKRDLAQCRREADTAAVFARLSDTQLQAMRTALTKAKAEAAELTTQLETQGEVAASRLAEHSRRVDALLGSRSWRITAPLRGLKRR